MAKRFKVVINGIELEIVRDSDGTFLIPDDLRGLGSALKPAHEPICVARKPFKGTVANNVLANRTGAINIDGCRIGSNGGSRSTGGDSRKESQKGAIGAYKTSPRVEGLGRWPANVIHDGSDEVVGEFAKYGTKGAAAPVKGTEKSKASIGNVTGVRARVVGAFHSDTGTAARFFYCAKASRKDRNEGLDDFPQESRNGKDYRRKINTSSGKERGDVPRANVHPTVKPTELMRYLVRLVTPPNGIVLDPFMGSGSTGKAAMLERFKFAGIDMTPEYIEISRARIKHARKQAEPKTETLFKKGKK